jgi:hypothetical protein
MIGATKGPGGFGITSLPSAGPVAKAPEVGKALEQLKTAVEGLSKNPIVRQLLGESGFEGLGAQGKGKALGHAKQAEKAGEAGDKAATPEEGLKKLVEGLKKFVEILEQLLGKKPAKGGEAGGEAPAAGGAGGGAPAGGAGGGEGAGGAGGAEGAGGAGGAEAAGGAEGAEEKDPLSQILEALTKILEQLQSLQQAMQGGNQNTGIVPPGATEPANTGIVPPGI